MESSQFLLKWNNHQPTVVSVLDLLYNQEAFVDVTLACDGQSFSAHKVVLSACSQYFQELLLKNPCKHPIIFLKDVRAADLSSLLQFMYRGEINVQQDDLPQFLRTAESLQIKGLADSSTDASEDPAEGSDCDVPVETSATESALDVSDHLDTSRLSTTLLLPGRVKEEVIEHPITIRSDVNFTPPTGSDVITSLANPSRSLLASALGKLKAKRSPKDGARCVADIKMSPGSRDMEVAGPSRTSTTSPPALASIFPVFGMGVLPNGQSGDASHLVASEIDWAAVGGGSRDESLVADSPQRSPENGETCDTSHNPPVATDRGVVSVHPSSWKRAQLFPQARGRPRSQPLPRMFECNLCGKTFNNRRRDRFLAHLRLHTGERPFKCVICGRGFNRQDHVTVHMRLHTGGKPFQCVVCKHRFAKQQELKAHPCVGPTVDTDKTSLAALVESARINGSTDCHTDLLEARLPASIDISTVPALKRSDGPD